MWRKCNDLSSVAAAIWKEDVENQHLWLSTRLGTHLAVFNR